MDEGPPAPFASNGENNHRVDSASRRREPSMNVNEDEVDRILDKMDGRIHRQRNEQL
jgi:hypothetical protein